MSTYSVVWKIWPTRFRFLNHNNPKNKQQQQQKMLNRAELTLQNKTSENNVAILRLKICTVIAAHFILHPSEFLCGKTQTEKR